MKPARSHVLVAMLLAASALGACSALGLGDHEIIHCDPDDSDGDAECAGLNAELPSDQCDRYYCSRTGRGCVPEPRDDDRDGLKNLVCADRVAASELDCDDDDERRDGREERCDGVDNDCNDLIDDGIEPGQVTTEIDIPEDLEHVSHAVLADGALYVALTHRNGALLETTRVTIPADGPSRSSALLSRDERCDAPAPATEACRIDELAFDVSASVLLAAGVHVSSCAQGQLRLGLAPAGLQRALELGDSEGGLSSFGVDVDRSRSCTRSTQCLGASSPAVAQLAAGEANAAAHEALVTWLAPVQSTPCEDEVCDCRGTEQGYQVEGLGVRIDSSSQQPRFVDAQMARASVLGSELAIGAPVVTPISIAEGNGYLLAYPSADGIELVGISMLDEDEPVGGTFANARIEASGADHPALARDRSTNAGLAVVFRSMVAGKPAIQLVPLTPQGSGAGRELAAGEPVVLEEEAEIIAGPAVSYAAEGFRSPDSEGAHGGWFVVWAVRDGAGAIARAARIAEAGHFELEPRLELARGAIESIFTFSKQRRAGAPSQHFGFVTNGTLHLNSLICEMTD